MVEGHSSYDNLRTNLLSLSIHREGFMSKSLRPNAIHRKRMKKDPKRKERMATQWSTMWGSSWEKPNTSKRIQGRIR